MSKGTKEVYRAAKRILQYLVNTSSLGIEIKKWKKEKWNMTVYTDASFADVKEDRYKSTAGCLIFLNESLISWKTKKLKWVCCSTAESEYLGVYYGAKDAIGLARLLFDFHGKDVFPIELKTDNKAVLHIVNNIERHVF